MLCSIDDFLLADGTISGGTALSDLRLSVRRVFDVVIPLAELNPVLLDRNKRQCDITFRVERVHASFKDAEIYINDHESTVPRSGEIKLFVTNESHFGLVLNGVLLSEELVLQIGMFTDHAYHLTGSFVSLDTSYILTEDDSFILTESGFKIELE